MAQYSTDFSEYTVDQQPSDWTQPGSPYQGDAEFHVKSRVDADVLNDAVLRALTENTNYTSGDHLLVWDTPGDFTDGEILCHLETPDFTNTTGTDYQNRLFLRASQTARTNYFLVFADGAVNLISEVDGTQNTVAGSIITPADLTWYWVRFQVSGTAIRVRIWTGAVGDEPGTWDFDGTDSAVSAAGRAGLGFWNDRPDRDFDYFAVGTGTDPAPSPGGGTTVSLQGSTTATLTASGTLTPGNLNAVALKAAASAKLTASGTLTVVGEVFLKAATGGALQATGKLTVTGDPLTELKWPAALPQYPLQEGFSEEPLDSTVSDSPDAGPVLSRQRFTGERSRMKCRWEMTRAQYNTFRQWFRTTVEGGALDFKMNHPTTEEEVDVRLPGAAWRLSSVMGDTYILETSFLVLP